MWDWEKTERIKEYRKKNKGSFYFMVFFLVLGIITLAFGSSIFPMLSIKVIAGTGLSLILVAIVGFVALSIKKVGIK